MLRPHICMVQRYCFFSGQRQDSFNSWSIRNSTDHFLLRSCAYLLLDFNPDGLKIEPEPGQNIYGDALSEPNQPQEQVFGSDEIVIEPISFSTRQRQNLLRPWSKVIESFHKSLPFGGCRKPLPKRAPAHGRRVSARVEI